MNKIKFLLLSAVLFSCLTLFSQKKDSTYVGKVTPEKRSKRFTYEKSTGISALYCLPIGTFGSTDINKGRFAGAGWGIGFDSRSFIRSSGFSFISYTSYSWIDIDRAALGKAFDTELQQILPTLSTQVTGGQHRPFYTTIGLGKDFYLSDRVQLGLSAQGGLLYTSFRKMDLRVYDRTSGALISEAIVGYDDDLAFAYLFGISGNFFLIKDVLALHVECNFSSANTDTNMNVDYGTTSETYRIKDKTQMINLNFGFVFCGAD